MTKPLFDIAEELARLSAATTAIGAELDSLIDIVAKHFASEETNVTKTGNAGFASHQAEHDKLIATCLDPQEKFHAGQADVTPQANGFVKDYRQRLRSAFDQQRRCISLGS
jgi:hemerythrin-like metal-binding protein